MSVPLVLCPVTLAALLFWPALCSRKPAPLGPELDSMGAVDDLFADRENVPLAGEPPPHELLVQHVLPVVAEQTWRLQIGQITPADQAAALATRAQARVDLRQFELAQADLDAAVALAPESADLRRQRAWFYGAVDLLDEAQAELDLAFRLEPHSTATARVLGLLRFEAGRFADAVAALSFRLEDDPAEPPLLVLHAIARQRAGEAMAPGEWATMADRAAELAPWPQAIASFMAGRLTRVDLLALGRGDTVDPSPVRACQAWFYLGQRAWLEGDPARAEHDWRNAIRTGGTAAVEYRLARAELGRGRAP